MTSKHPASYISAQIRPGEKVGILNLGCSRNLVDAQELLGRIKQSHRQISDVRNADVVILNTCGFVEDAKRESLDAIVELIELKKQGVIKKIFVVGCLAERYPQELRSEFAEIDGLAGINPFLQKAAPRQVYLTPTHYAYVKICESCYQHCSFCAIPHIKGPFVSRTMEAVLKEVVELEQRGVKEIILIGQDITAYGLDLYKTLMLTELLRRILSRTQKIRWIRLLYTFPSHITDDLIDLMAREERMCKYMDVPLQHINDRILKAMRRKITSRQTRRLVDKIRAVIPGVCLRTSMIVGFPGETEEEFEELVAFVKETGFERLGTFCFSREEGTPAYRMKRQVDQRIKKQRFNRLMKVQQRLSSQIQKKRLGSILRVLVDERQKDGQNVYIGRTEYDAPEVDGLVYIHARRRHRPGDFVRVKITDTLEYDLVGEEI